MLRTLRVPQSASMSTLWHPALRADWLVLRRTGPKALVRMLGAPALLLAGCVVLACGDLYRGYGWCLVAAALLVLGGSYAIAHQRLLDALERWRFGWCGALPTPRRAAAYTLLLVTTIACAVSLALVAALLVGVATGAPHRGDLVYALAGIGLALFVGTIAAALRVFRRGAFAARQADGIREPLLALPWLNDPRLPHLLDWQRRAALVRWRRGGGAMMGALALFVIPDGATVVTGAGLVLFVISLTWLDVVLRASVQVTAGAVRLLRATPLDGGRLRTASFRYPALATACACVLAGAGAGLTGGDWAIAASGGAACGIAVVAWPVVRILGATRDPGTPT